MKAKILSIFLTAVILSCTAGCTSAPEYRSDAAVTELCAAASPLLADSEQMTAMSADYVANWFGTDVSSFADYAMVVRSSATNVDEYGIFKASDTLDVKEVEKLVNSYLERRDRVWMPEYSPEERPKLDEAEVKVMGDYVVYAILSSTDRATVFDAIESTLTVK